MSRSLDQQRVRARENPSHHRLDQDLAIGKQGRRVICAWGSEAAGHGPCPGCRVVEFALASADVTTRDEHLAVGEQVAVVIGGGGGQSLVALQVPLAASVEFRVGQRESRLVP